MHTTLFDLAGGGQSKNEALKVHAISPDSVAAMPSMQRPAVGVVLQRCSHCGSWPLLLLSVSAFSRLLLAPLRLILPAVVSPWLDTEASHFAVDPCQCLLPSSLSQELLLTS